MDAAAGPQAPSALGRSRVENSVSLVSNQRGRALSLSGLCYVPIPLAWSLVFALIKHFGSGFWFWVFYDAS